LGVQRKIPAVPTAGAKADNSQLVALDDVQALEIGKRAQQVRQSAVRCCLLIQPEGLFRVLRRTTETREEVDAKGDKPSPGGASGDIAYVLVQTSVLVDYEDPRQRLDARGSPFRVECRQPGLARLGVARASLVREDPSRFAGELHLAPLQISRSPR